LVNFSAIRSRLAIGLGIDKPNFPPEIDYIDRKPKLSEFKRVDGGIKSACNYDPLDPGDSERQSVRKLSAVDCPRKTIMAGLYISIRLDLRERVVDGVSHTARAIIGRDAAANKSMPQTGLHHNSARWSRGAVPRVGIALRCWFVGSGSGAMTKLVRYYAACKTDARVGARYDHHEYGTEMREAIEKWAGYVANLVQPRLVGAERAVREDRR
jgi:hypothetical protein